MIMALARDTNTYSDDLQITADKYVIGLFYLMRSGPGVQCSSSQAKSNCSNPIYDSFKMIRSGLDHFKFMFL